MLGLILVYAFALFCIWETLSCFGIEFSQNKVLVFLLWAGLVFISASVLAFVLIWAVVFFVMRAAERLW